MKKINLLSPREKEVLGLLNSDVSNNNIAAKLRLNTKTIEHYKLNITKKLNLNTYIEVIDNVRQYQVDLSNNKLNY